MNWKITWKLIASTLGVRFSSSIQAVWPQCAVRRQWSVGNIVGGCDLIKKSTKEVKNVMLLYVKRDEPWSIGSIWTDITVVQDHLWCIVCQIGWKCIVAKVQEDIFCMQTPTSTSLALKFLFIFSECKIATWRIIWHAWLQWGWMKFDESAWSIQMPEAQLAQKMFAENVTRIGGLDKSKGATNALFSGNFCQLQSRCFSSYKTTWDKR